MWCHPQEIIKQKIPLLYYEIQKRDLAFNDRGRTIERRMDSPFFSLATYVP